MRLAWLTDIHLNFLDASERRRFLESVKDQADVVAVSGDIGESHNVAKYLQEMEEVVQKPIYFVLGNHDFYRGSIAKTRVQVAELAKESKCLNYLTVMGVAELTPTTAIVGHDGWPDGRLGDYDGTTVILSDHSLIEEIARSYQYFYLDKYSLRATMTALADEAERHFERVVTEAAVKYRQVIVVTHIPPFREAAWYRAVNFKTGQTRPPGATPPRPSIHGLYRPHFTRKSRQNRFEQAPSCQGPAQSR